MCIKGHMHNVINVNCLSLNRDAPCWGVYVLITILSFHFLKDSYQEMFIFYILAFVAAKVIGARLGRWDIEGDPPMGSPTNACVGLFMLWWGWFAFNAGSTFGMTKMNIV